MLSILYRSSRTPALLITALLISFGTITEVSAAGTVEVRTTPAGVTFGLEGPGMNIQGKTPAMFTDLSPGLYRVTYDLTKDCTAKKQQERSMGLGETLVFVATLDCGNTRIPIGGSTAKPIGTGMKPPAPKVVPVHTITPSQRVSQTSSAAEAVPGGRIRITVSVRNITRGTLHAVRITESFDPDAVEILQPLSKGGIHYGSELLWEVPQIFAGSTWTTTFDIRAKSHLKPGDRIVLRAHAVSDEEGSSFLPDAWSSVVGIGIVTLPQTGGMLDMIVAIAALAIAAIVTGKSRSLKQLRSRE